MAIHKFTIKNNKVSEESVEDKPKKKLVTKKAAEKTPKVAKSGKKPNVFRRMGEYFAGAWREVRQVRWPNRRQTWELTLAVILFSLLLGATIFGLDALFTWLFTKVIL